MKGKPKIIERLNELLADELTAINQYMVHSEMCDNWGYAKLHGAIEKRARDEMKHAEKLIGRLLFLEGLPVVSKLNPIKIGPDIEKQFRSDQAAETGAIVEALARAGIPAARIGRAVKGGECQLLSPEGARQLPAFARDEIARLFE